MIQEIINDIGKLGPLAVAVAVYVTSLFQSRRSNAITARAALVDDQKFRLQLLDKRMVAIEAVRDAMQDWSASAGVGSTAIEKTWEALKVAQLVYDETQEAEIIACMRLLQGWSSLNRRVAALRDTDEVELARAVERLVDEEELISAALLNLFKNLQRATQVRIPPPVPSTKS